MTSEIKAKVFPDMISMVQMSIAIAFSYPANYLIGLALRQAKMSDR